MLDQDLFEKILVNPAVDGADKLEIISGFATANMAEEHLIKLKDNNIRCRIRLAVGMVSNGVNIAHYRGFQKLSKSYDFLFGYGIKSYPIHAKVYVWKKEGKPFCAFAGSANYTQTGFGKIQKEIMVPVDAKVAWQWCKIKLSNSFEFNTKKLESRVRFFKEQKTEHYDTVCHDTVLIPLVQKSNGEVHNKSGLNWGNRKGRDSDQSYIPIPSYIRERKFFPPRAEQFDVITDDGEKFKFAVAQDGEKALHTTENNSLLGKYFRKRLGLKSGEYVHRRHLEKYGRCDVSFSNISNEYYLMDFSLKIDY